MRSGFATVEARGKIERSWQVKNLIDAFKDAFNFVLEDHKFTIRRHVDEEGEETDIIVLIIDDVPFLKHPLVSSDFGKCLFLIDYSFKHFSYYLVFCLQFLRKKRIESSHSA